MEKIRIERPYQSSFQLETNSEVVVEYIKKKFEIYRVNKWLIDKNKLTVLYDSRMYHFLTNAADFWAEEPVCLIERYIKNITEYDESVLPIHGAAVETNGKAILFLAPSTTGKSTLCAFLVNCGFNFITEDCILIDRNTMVVHPNLLPVQLRIGGVKVLRNCMINLGELYEIKHKDELRYLYSPQSISISSSQIWRVFFIERNEEHNEKVLCSQYEMFKSLLLSPITPYSINKNQIKDLFQIAKGKCYKLRYKSMDYVRDVILDELYSK